MFRGIIIIALGLPALASAATPNTIALQYHKPLDQGGEWVEQTSTVPFSVAIVQQWPGSETWALYLSNGTREGAESCGELAAPTGDLMVSVILRGRPDFDGLSQVMASPGWVALGEVSDAAVYHDGFNSALPLAEFASRHVRIDGMGPDGVVLGDLGLMGEDQSGRSWRIAGRFRALHCGKISMEAAGDSDSSKTEDP